MYRLLQALMLICCIALMAGCTIAVTVDASDIPTLRVELVEPETEEEPGDIRPLDESISEPALQPDSKLLHVVNILDNTQIDGAQVYAGTWVIADRVNLKDQWALLVSGLSAEITRTDEPAVLLAHPVADAISNTLTLFLPGISGATGACTDTDEFFWQEVFILGQEGDVATLPVAQHCLYGPGTTLSDFEDILTAQGLAPDAFIVVKDGQGPVLYRLPPESDDPGAGEVISRLLCSRLRTDTPIANAVRKYLALSCQ